MRSPHRPTRKLAPILPCYTPSFILSHHPQFTYFTSLVTLQLGRLVCRNSEEQFLMSSKDTRSAAGSAADSAAEPAAEPTASQSLAFVPPPTLLGAPTSKKRKASQLSTSSQMPSMAPPPRRSTRLNKNKK